MRLGPGRTVVDLAAGTGKLARLLVPSGAHVVAVEPVEAMRRLLEGLGVEALAGAAEAIPLPDGCADGVAVAQALHWFRVEEALHEVHRILRPAGVLAVVYNQPDPNDPVQRAFVEIVARHRGHERLRLEHGVGEAIERSGLFGKAERHAFANEQRLDAATLLARGASESSIAILEPEPRAAALDELDALARTLPPSFVMRYETQVWLARHRPD
jgi:SAM-dependent methyltransferase